VNYQTQNIHDLLCLNPPEVRRSFGSAIGSAALHAEG
jgi:hypothetical protein